MNKVQLIDAIKNEQPNITKSDIERVLDAFVEIVTESLTHGERVVLVGFGSFTVKDKAAREGRNPKTGEVVEIEARRVVKFKPGSELAERVNS